MVILIYRIDTELKKELKKAKKKQKISFLCMYKHTNIHEYLEYNKRKSKPFI
jgi:hypothetical protein